MGDRQNGVKVRKKLLLLIIPFLTIFLIAAIWFAWKGNDPSPAEVPEEAVQTPWNEGGKPPSEYTWAEYEALSDLQKEAFYESFASAEEFDLWLTAAGGVTVPEETPPELPWEKEEKQPQDYTWEEYEGLDPEVKDAFFESFAASDDFDQWKAVAQEETLPKENLQEYPWEVEKKQPADYTWEEYQKLDEAVKDAFFESFETAESFEQWLDRVKPDIPEETPPSEEAVTQLPWESGGKKPEDYTWEEFEELTPEQQEEFFLSFSSAEAFEDWMLQANGQS